jgi:phenylacetic acid degradation operon negative regulatory protein
MSEDPSGRTSDIHLAALLADVRPLGARSVVASTLLGAEIDWLPVDRLVRSGELFGIAEGATRTAVWRMVAAGELAGRDGCYRLAGSLLARRQRASDNTLGRRRPWDGTWEMVVVGVERRSVTARQELRAATAALHLAELRDGVWMRPDNLAPDRLPEQRAVVERQCTRIDGARLTDDVVDRLFHPQRWAAQARSLIDALESAAHPPDDLGHGDLATGFRLSIAVVRHLNADPLLPDALLPADWPGAALRELYSTYHQAYERRFGAWLNSSAGSGSGGAV